MERQQAYLESEVPESAWDWAVAAASAEVLPARDPRVEDYLDRVCATLVRRVPFDRRQELRAEMGRHLDLLVAQLRARHTFGGDAGAAALRRFGSPRRLGRRWLREWSGSEGASSPTRLLRSPILKATLVSLGCFTTVLLPAMWYMLLASISSGWGVLGVLCLAFVDEWRFSHWLCGALLIGVCVPLCAGIAAGWLARKESVRATVYAVAILGLALPGAVQLSPFADHPLVGVSGPFRVSDLAALAALAAFVVWMPIGCAGAALGGRLRARTERVSDQPEDRRGCRATAV